jgi:hypothetical protein
VAQSTTRICFDESIIPESVPDDRRDTLLPEGGRNQPPDRRAPVMSDDPYEAGMGVRREVLAAFAIAQRALAEDEART